MDTEVDVEQLFASLRPRIAEIQARDAPRRDGGNLGCLLMVAPFVAPRGPGTGRRQLHRRLQDVAAVGRRERRAARGSGQGPAAATRGAAAIDEIRGSIDADLPACWLVRVELPFVVAGHVLIHRRTMATPGIFWRDDFERLEDDSRRLDRGSNVELGPLGVGTDEGIAAPPPGSVSPTSDGVPAQQLALVETVAREVVRAGSARR